MVLKYVIAEKPTLFEDMVAKIWEAGNDNPGAEVYTVTIPERDGTGTPTPGAGHQVPYQLTANGLDLLTHVVRLFTVGGTPLHEYTAESKVDGITIFDPIRFKIGDGGDNTPDADSNQYRNDLLLGLTDEEYGVFRNGYGYLFPGTHYENLPDEGGFNLLGDDTFTGPIDDEATGEEFVILRKSKVVTNVVNDSVVGKWFGGFIDIAANLSYDPSHLRKMLRFTNPVDYTFEEDDNIPIGYGFCFNNFGEGAANSFGTINFLNAELIWHGGNKTELELPLFCEACLAFDGVAWNVVYIVQSTFIEGGSVPQGKTIGVGTMLVGNIPRAAQDWEVVHNGNVSGDYNVFLSIRGTAATSAADTNMVVSWRHHASDKPNRFIFTTREPENVSSLNNATICWIIIKN